MTTANYNSDGGDSGGIVYGVYHNTDTNTRTNCVAGVHRGRLGNYAVFSKVTEIVRGMNVYPN